MLDRWFPPAAEEDLWIWPAVYWVELDGEAIGALAYSHRGDMFWGVYEVVPFMRDSPVVTSRFWETTFSEAKRVRIVNAWTGVAVQTFSGKIVAPDAIVSQISMRSLFPVVGERATEERSRRHLHRMAVDDAVKLEKQQWLREQLGGAPLTGHLSLALEGGELSMPPAVERS